MDSELKERLVKLETLIDSLIKRTTRSQVRIEEKMGRLTKHVNEEICDIREELRDERIWRASHTAKWEMLRALGAGGLGAIISIGVALILRVI